MIHKKHFIDFLIKKGIKPISRIKSKKKAKIIIRTHGISPEKSQKLIKLSMQVIDVTCPKVKYVQSIIKKYSLKGYEILIIGNKIHPEFQGLLGYAKYNKSFVINSQKDIEYLLPKFKKICVGA